MHNRIQPNLVRIARMPNTNVSGHILVSGQFGPNSQNAEKECFWAHSGFRPIWSKPGATHPPTHPGATHPPTHPGATHPPTHPPGRHTSSRAPPTHPPTRAPPIEQPECRKRMFLGTFGLQPNLVRTAGMPKTNVFGHLRASAQVGPNSQNAKYECFWAQECRMRMFFGTFGLQPNLVRIARMPYTNVFGHIRVSDQFGPNNQNAEKECFWAPSGFRPIWSKPGATHPPTHPGATHPPTHPSATHRRARMPKTNVFGHIQASAPFGPNSPNAENECFWAHFWAHSGFSPIWSE